MLYRSQNFNHLIDMPSSWRCKTKSEFFVRQTQYNRCSFYRSMAKNIFDVQSALNSVSHVAKNSNISLIIVRILFELIKAKHNSIARLKLNYKWNLLSFLFLLTVWSKRLHLSNTPQSLLDVFAQRFGLHEQHVIEYSMPHNECSCHCSKESDPECSRLKPIEHKYIHEYSNEELILGDPIQIWYP